MLQHKDHFHGSDLEKIEQIYGIRKDEIVSFSANVNPLGISPLLRETLAAHIDAISSYPDREYLSLRKCIGEYVGTDYENIIMGNGSTELISLFIQLKHPKKALIIGPTYSEYEREISLGGGTCLYYPLREEQDFVLDERHFTAQLHEGIDLLVLCNPNNPTGVLASRGLLKRMLDTCAQAGAILVADECFLDFVVAKEGETESLKSFLEGYDNLFLVKAFTKTFGIPGLRLGYGLCGNLEVLERMREATQPWNVSVPAQEAGIAAAKEKLWDGLPAAKVSEECGFQDYSTFLRAFQSCVHMTPTAFAEARKDRRWGTAHNLP